jgi:hypothetical protein
MSWLKLSDDAFGSPRFIALPRSVRLLYLELLAWRGAHQTELVDDVIPEQAFAYVTDAELSDGAIPSLLEAGAIVTAERGYQLVWWVDDQMKLDEVVARKKEANKRQERHRRHVSDDHTLCDPQRCRALIARAATRDKRVNNDPSYSALPSPSRPQERDGEEEGEPASGADAAAGGAEPAAAAPPANVRWLPLREDDYETEPWRDDYFRCERCFGYFPQEILEDHDNEQWMCPFCWERVRTRRGQNCFAFTVAKKDQASRPCGHKHPPGSRWCKYHEREVPGRLPSRGQAPEDQRRWIDEAAD